MPWIQSKYEAQVALAALKKYFEEHGELLFVNAPHAASGPAYEEVQNFFQPPFFEWWNAVKVMGQVVLQVVHDTLLLSYKLDSGSHDFLCGTGIYWPCCQ